MISRITDLGFQFPVMLCCIQARRFRKLHYWQSYTFCDLSGGEFDYVSMNTLPVKTSHQTFATFLPGYQEPGLHEFQGKLIYTYPAQGTWRVGLTFPPAAILTTFMEDLAVELGLERFQLPPWFEISQYVFDTFTVPAQLRVGDFTWWSERTFSPDFRLYLLRNSRAFLSDPTVFDLQIDNVLHHFDLLVGILPGRNGWAEPYSTFQSRVILHGPQPQFPKITNPSPVLLSGRAINCGRCCDCCCDCA